MEQRHTTLAFAILATLSAGTNYLFSTYSPQLAASLALSSTQINSVGISANLGVYLSGPVVGRLVDSRGPRLVLSLGACAILAGYLSIRAIYDGGLGKHSAFNAVGIYGLIAAEALTGIGSCCALSSSTNSVAKSFQSESRGGYLSLVMSAFGVSAAFFSSLSHLPFLQNDFPSSLLLLLALWTTTSLLLGAVFIRPSIATPGESPEGYKALDDDEVESPVEEFSRPAPPQQEEQVSGIALFKERDFQLLWSVMLLLSGTGLMYINNVGTMVQALATAEAARTFSRTVESLATAEIAPSVPLSTMQAHLVTVLSIFNCAGRLFSGFTSDYFIHRAPESFRFPRLVWLSIVSALFIISQLAALNARSVDGLVYPTAMVGFSYGALFGIMPVLCLEAHGVASFSGNNGLLSLAPAVGGNFANIAFGRLYDLNVPLPKLLPSANLANSSRSLPGDILPRAAAARDPSKLCVLGQSCYVQVFYLTLGMCSLALVISFFAARRAGRVRREKERAAKERWESAAGIEN